MVSRGARRSFWPRILVSHYTFGAVLWISGALTWSWFVLPKVWQTDNE